RASWVPAGLAATFAGVAAAADLRAWAGDEVVGVDPLTFHLPNVGRWIQSGTLWEIDQFLPLLAHGNYPNNGDVVLLSVVLPFHNDFLARFAITAFALLAAVAVFAIARELRAPVAAAVLAGAAVVTIPVVGLSAIPRAMPDSVLYATFACGALFLLRHARTTRRSDLLLAGTAFGLAFGTKWYGPSCVGVVVAVWVIARLVARQPRWPVLRDGALLGGLGVLGGATWLVRNLVESGNPLFPVKVQALGVTIFDAPADPLREAAGFSIAHYAGDPSVLGEIGLELIEGLGLLVIVGTVGLLAAALTGVRRIDRRVLVTGIGAIALGAVYVITPYTALGLENEPGLASNNTRYAVPALVLAAPVTAWAVGRLRRAGLALEAALALAVLTGANSGFAIQGAGSIVRSGVVLGAAGAAGWWLWRRATALRSRPVLVALGCATAVLVGLAGGYRMQKAVNDGRYIGMDPAVDVVVRTAPEDRRIGLAAAWSVEGVSPIWPSFGTRIGNDVEYVGHFVDGFLTEYSDGGAFGAALRRGRYDLLVIGRGLFPPQRVPEERWAASAGWRTIALSTRLRVLVPPA
nr:glycosyltransferase family 39 protein [Solirubrobacterales bacterium]